MHYDVKISGARIRTHDLWIQKRVCYPLHNSVPLSRQVIECYLRLDSKDGRKMAQCETRILLVAVVLVGASW